MKATIILDTTRDNNGNFHAGYRVSIGTKYVTINYLTDWQGDRDKRWRVTIADFDNLPCDSIEDKMMRIVDNEDPEWRSRPIF